MIYQAINENPKKVDKRRPVSRRQSGRLARKKPSQKKLFGCFLLLTSGRRWHLVGQEEKKYITQVKAYARIFVFSRLLSGR